MKRNFGVVIVVASLVLSGHFMPAHSQLFGGGGNPLSNIMGGLGGFPGSGFPMMGNGGGFPGSGFIPQGSSQRVPGDGIFSPNNGQQAPSGQGPPQQQGQQSPFGGFGSGGGLFGRRPRPIRDGIMNALSNMGGAGAGGMGGGPLASFFQRLGAGFMG